MKQERHNLIRYILLFAILAMSVLGWAAPVAAQEILLVDDDLA